MKRSMLIFSGIIFSLVVSTYPQTITQVEPVVVEQVVVVNPELSRYKKMQLWARACAKHVQDKSCKAGNRVRSAAMSPFNWALQKAGRTVVRGAEHEIKEQIKEKAKSLLPSFHHEKAEETKAEVNHTTEILQELAEVAAVEVVKTAASLATKTLIENAL